MNKPSTIIGPLNFAKDDNMAQPFQAIDDTHVPCLFCDNFYDFKIDNEKDQYLAHLYLVHRLVIADINEIDCLPSYITHWKANFKESPVEKYCTSMLMNQLPDGTPANNEKYFLLSDILPEDFELRQKIKKDVLERVLGRHQFERIDENFNRECLYCRDFISKTRSSYIEHLYTKHFLQLGKAQNLVFVDELIDKVQSKLQNFICLYCEKTFKDRPTLKEHMRKKGHKRINPDNKNYDKYFLVNYKNDKLRKSSAESRVVHDPNSKPNEFHTDDSDSDWSDWNGEEQPSTCLFCKETKNKVTDLKDHMIMVHDFNFDREVASFNFYQKVKIVNYIRRQVHILRCVECNSQCGNYEELQLHLRQEKHFKIGEKSSWDQPEFFFPTYEDDAFLCHLDDNLDNNSDDSSVVISEKINVNVSSEAETLSLEKFNLE